MLNNKHRVRAAFCYLEMTGKATKQLVQRLCLWNPATWDFHLLEYLMHLASLPSDLWFLLF